MDSYLPATGLGSFGTLPEIDMAIQAGRGATAAVLGQTYNVFRLGPTTSTSVLGGAPIMANFPIKFGPREGKVEIENEPFGLLVMVGECDNESLQIGDIVVETGYRAHAGNQFIFAQFRPPRDSIFVRVENNSGIQRPHPDGGAASDQPTQGWVAQNTGTKKYGGITPFNRDYLSLWKGLYAFVHAGAVVTEENEGFYAPLPLGAPIPAAQVPVGIQPRSRTRDRHEPDLPTNIAESEFYIYAPPLPGVEISEIDVFKAMHADNYEARGIFASDEAGLQGYIVLARKLAS